MCKTSNCWLPQGYNVQRSRSARLINEIVLSEETDFDLDNINIISHFELYCKAMEEIGKLEDARIRLEDDLKICRAEPGKFEPGCEEDLVFQITRLREEVRISYCTC